MASLKVPKGYNEDFDPEWYINTFYATVKGHAEEGDFLPMVFDTLHELFKSGDIKGDKLLDLGTGPSIHSVISASRHVKEIHLSDFAEQNRSVLKKWLAGEDRQLNAFEYIMQLEADGTPLQSRIKEVREKVTEILPIDVTRDEPIEGLQSPYDVIISSLCLEAVTTSNEEYAQNAGKVAAMLKPRGYFVLVGVLNQTFYRVGDFKFFCTKIGAEELKSVYENVGFEIKVWKEMANSEYKQHAKEHEYSDFESAFIMYAQKVR